jgi:hypothetical protein
MPMEADMSGLRPDQLADLLKVAADDDVPWLLQEWQPVDALFQAKLAEPIPFDPSRPDSVPAVVGRPCREMGAYASFGALLADPQADVAALAALKDYAKALARRSRCFAAEATTTALYYAAIAAALVYRDTLITRHAYGDLRRSLMRLIERPWLPVGLRVLFGKAGDVCRQRAGKDGEEADA